MSRATWVNAKYESMDHGLSDLQRHYLLQELRINHSRPTNLLRSIAKARAFKQRVLWIFQEMMVVVGLFMSILFVAVLLIIWQM
ncbi:hypothetical protein ABER99_20540 [Paenibacillus glucanolyticus]|uniref:Uncharacterized protein n=1 Tax=Paenibacillus glucanolyticus TaxID=59843 RepID=A0A168EX37_9BACL|nr:hypothetical protein [Paenibacillus glucanolyticus]KZS44906.1 hypothetical protein AWU65_02675 [Paenibacillus glucanolyticus]OMF65545.1 hypothetical protein BK142_30505 [Paenibacillus glucanolyticus]